MSQGPEARPRRGRPRAADAAKVDQRVLDAASRLFLAEGYDRTTLDQVAASARCGKTTLYSRYPNKEALFTAVVRRSTDAFFVRASEVDAGGSYRERLVQAGRALAEETLTDEVVALMRATAAVAAVFPVLAREGQEIGADACIRAAAQCLADGGAPAAEATSTATYLVEMALQPLYFRAVLGADLAELRARAPQDVEDVADLLLGEDRDTPPPHREGPS